MARRREANTGFAYLHCAAVVPPDDDNADTIIIKQAGMYDFSQVSAVPGWTPKDKTQLVNALLEHSRNIKEKELKLKYAALRSDKKGDNLKQIASIEKELSQLPNKTLLEIALPLHQDYDWEGLANSLDGGHTAREYKVLWTILLHPAIRKSPWDHTEHEQLMNFIQESPIKDWDLIAKILNTGRTGYQCFVYYHTNMFHYF